VFEDSIDSFNHSYILNFPNINKSFVQNPHTSEAVQSIFDKNSSERKLQK